MRLDDHCESCRLIAAYVAFLDVFAATAQKADEPNAEAKPFVGSVALVAE
jgi:hypothetical protein